MWGTALRINSMILINVITSARNFGGFPKRSSNFLFYFGVTVPLMMSNIPGWTHEVWMPGPRNSQARVKGVPCGDGWISTRKNLLRRLDWVYVPWQKRVGPEKFPRPRSSCVRSEVYRQRTL